MRNPQAAVDALTACGEKVGGVVLNELTLGRVALLEKVGSVFAKGKVETSKLSAMDMLPAMYILAEPVAAVMAQIRDGTFDTAVMEWADTIAMGEITELAEAVKRIFRRVEAVAPQGMVDGEGGDEKKQVAATAG